MGVISRVGNWAEVEPTGTSAHLSERLLRRIGLDEAPSPDAEGLRVVHRAFVSSVPYENLTVQLGESGPLDRDAICERILSGGRGGYCFEINTALLTLLEGLGFVVERRQGVVGPRGAAANGEPTNHMALVATTADGEEFIVEAGWGEGSLEPVPLLEGTTTLGPFSWTVAREGEGWWVSQHEFGSTPGFGFSDAPAALGDFDPFHRHLSTSEKSGFVATLVVQQPHDDHIVTLRSRTLTKQGPDIDERAVLSGPAHFAAALREEFGIDPDDLGGERLERLWSKAVAQHERYMAKRAGDGKAAAE